MEDSKKYASKHNKLLNVIMIVLLVGIFGWLLVASLLPKENKISYNEFESKVTSGEIVVKEVYIQNGEEKAYILLVDSKYENIFPKRADYVIVLDNNGVTQEKIFNLSTNAPTLFDVNVGMQAINLWDYILPFLYFGLIIGSIVLFYKLMNRSNNKAISFGKTNIDVSRDIDIRITDVAGIDEEKEELMEIVDFLKYPKKYTDVGARIPKGVLLVGQPGTGKTLLAKVIAGESKVPFFSISGSDFVEMFVGVGASRVRDLFDKAKHNTPCIVFIDEIDAVGRQRGAGMGGGNDEREQTLNQLLVEMDGFKPNQGIIVIAATNRADILDPALTRPGRFDKIIYVYPPDVKGREEILEVHARKKPLDSDVDLKKIARLTSGFTGADLENLLNEAALLTAKQGRTIIDMKSITDSINKVMIGAQKKSRVISESDKLITAYHEAGHAIIGKTLPHCDAVQEISIIPRGMAAGYTLSRDDEDSTHMSLSKLNDTLAMMMGGRIAEEVIIGDITTGAQNDIQRATKIARKMVIEWGMSEKIGFVGYDSSNDVFLGRDYTKQAVYSDALASTVDDEVKRILDANYKRAKEIINQKRNIIDQIVKVLLEKETIYSDEIDKLFNGATAEEVIADINTRQANEAKNSEIKKINVNLSNIEKVKDNRMANAQQMFKLGLVDEKTYKNQIQIAKENYEKEKIVLLARKSELEKEVDSSSNQSVEENISASDLVDEKLNSKEDVNNSQSKEQNDDKKSLDSEDADSTNKN